MGKGLGALQRQTTIEPFLGDLGFVAGCGLALSFRYRSRAQVFGTAVPCVHPYGYDGFQTVEGNQQQQRIAHTRQGAYTAG